MFNRMLLLIVAVLSGATAVLILLIVELRALARENDLLINGYVKCHKEKEKYKQELRKIRKEKQ